MYIRVSYGSYLYILIMWTAGTYNIDTGMIAMLNRKHGFFYKFIHEPVIKKVAFKTEVPFLVLPEAE